ncbi:hypothetical protein J6590_007641 [Homalodisca vitripennis]|nr:hypothetical protein J6590_007641 [Homalodisca vitripennis]
MSLRWSAQLISAGSTSKVRISYNESLNAHQTDICNSASILLAAPPLLPQPANTSPQTCVNDAQPKSTVICTILEQFWFSVSSFLRHRTDLHTDISDVSLAWYASPTLCKIPYSLKGKGVRKRSLPLAILVGTRRAAVAEQVAEAVAAVKVTAARPALVTHYYFTFLTVMLHFQPAVGCSRSFTSWF